MDSLIRTKKTPCRVPVWMAVLGAAGPFVSGISLRDLRLGRGLLAISTAHPLHAHVRW